MALGEGHWPFVWAAYGITFGVLAALIVLSLAPLFHWRGKLPEETSSRGAQRAPEKSRGAPE